jgi:hypothetical protein
MKKISTLAAVVMLFATTVMAAGGGGVLSPAESAGGLKAALHQAVTVAVADLGKTDGFMGNPDVRIPLPGKLRKAVKALRKLGAGKQSDALVLAMNRAAEAAVPEAKGLLVESIQQMDVKDALAILGGPADAATQYFRKSMSDHLTEALLPIVSKATKEQALADLYKDMVGKATALGLVNADDADLDRYVTRKALDGLFLTMAKEEAAIRKNPLGQASSVLRKVFGAVGK